MASLRMLTFLFLTSQGGEIQTRVGLLLLLCSWLSNCSLAVAHFLHNAANIPYVSFEQVTPNAQLLGNQAIKWNTDLCMTAFPFACCDDSNAVMAVH